MKTLIKNATVVMPDETVELSVLIDGEQIADIDPAIQTIAEETVDAKGLHLIPGVVDDQVHFREPGLTQKEDFQHATHACAKGGVTSFLEMPNTIPATVTQQRLHEKLELASKKCLVNYGFYIGATPDNIGELAGATRTPGIKIFIGSSTGDLLVDQQEALERIFAETTLPICAHCEDESTVRNNMQKFAGQTDISVHSKIRDHNAALVATRRAVELATRHNHPFHVLHVSTAEEISVIKQAPSIVSAEVCPHHLFFNIDDYQRLGSLVKMNPSIKTKSDNDALWNALLDGTIRVIATDHAPHTLSEKRAPYPACPSGLPAVENSLALMLNQIQNGRCTLEQVVNWMCYQPSRIWRMKRKGAIAVGNDADIVLIDLRMKQEVVNAKQQTKCKWSPWNGQVLQGWAVRTWVMGQTVFRIVDGQPRFGNRPNGREIEFDRATD